MKDVNLKVDNRRLTLRDIPGLEAKGQARCKVKALEIDGRCPVLSQLLKWKRNLPADYKKIMKVMRFVESLDRVRDKNHVKPSDNPSHANVYEMRAHKGHARLMFFYHKGQAIAVCTNPYTKAKTSHAEQDQAFALCNRLRVLFEQES